MHCYQIYLAVDLTLGNKVEKTSLELNNTISLIYHQQNRVIYSLSLYVTAEKSTTFHAFSNKQLTLKH